MKKAIIAVALLCVAQAGFSAEPVNSPNMLTNGMVQMTVRVGTTTQGEVLETFGAPNITSIDGSGLEMWVYDRQATVTSDSSSGFSIGMLIGAVGGGVGGGGGLGFGKKKSKSETSSRSMTLILKFDSRKVVTDFRSRSSSF